jgi:hypothetical protein
MRRDTHGSHGGHALFGSDTRRPAMLYGGEDLEKNGELTQGSWTCSEMSGMSPGRDTDVDVCSNSGVDHVLAPFPASTAPGSCRRRSKR